MVRLGNDSLKCKQTLNINGKEYDYFSLPKASEALGIDLSRLPCSLKVLLENLLRFEDGDTVTVDNIKEFGTWLEKKTSESEIAYRPARVLMQDFTGVPAVVDLAAMRDAMQALGNDPKKINPLAPVDLVIDHSVQVDKFGTPDAFRANVEYEMQRNRERYELLRSAQEMFDNFRVVPPGTGICHQVNLEYLAKVVWTAEVDGRMLAYPDTLVGTDSHTTMINGLSVLGWGVGGIEAEAAMLGQPISMTIPEVIGFKLTGNLKEGTTATDLVLTVTQMLREKGVVGKFVEFYGDGLSKLSLADQATVANMAPEYGATCGFFPISEETLNYINLTGREEYAELIQTYAKAQGLWHDNNTPDPVFTDTLELNMMDVEPCLSGPKRPQDRVTLSELSSSIKSVTDNDNPTRQEVPGESFDLGNGDVVIAAITSCTNTSNPSVMIAAGLVAQKARALGMNVKPWVKTSLAPGSQVVTEYLKKTNLEAPLNELGFDLVGYGCTTCIGNSGPLPDPIEQTIKWHDITVASVLSGNRNFEGRVHQLVKANYLASPPLVVAYALAGTVNIDISSDAVGKDKDGNDVYLKDIWPSNEEIRDAVTSSVTAEMFKSKYANVFSGDDIWKKIPATDSETYQWNPQSTYIKNPPFFEGMNHDLPPVSNIEDACILALLGDSITTDHISPAGAIAKDSAASEYLESKGVEQKDFNSYGSRRGNDDVMVRGTFANIRIRNEMVAGKEGGYTVHIPSGNDTPLTIFDAAQKYKANNTPLVVIAGKDYGMGSSRDWAAKGTRLLGIKAVVAESFERIHRSNLVGMGVLPLTFTDGDTRKTLKLNGSERISITGLEEGISPRMTAQCTITYADNSQKEVSLLCRLDTADEVEYFRHGGILHRAIRTLSAA